MTLPLILATVAHVTIQTACHPADVKHYDTATLRERFVMEKVMAPDEINLTYTMYDRLIYGGAMPVKETRSTRSRPNTSSTAASSASSTLAGPAR